MVRIDGILGSLLGQTSSRIHEVFRFAERLPCVLLLDELDALGRRRGERQDVAELDRVVVGLMQELDYTTLPGLVVATTNFIAAVDDALVRRFDMQLSFPLPDRAALGRFLGARATTLGSDVDTVAMLRALPEGTSYAEAERLLLDRVRADVLARLASPEPPSRPRRR